MSASHFDDTRKYPVPITITKTPYGYSLGIVVYPVIVKVMIMDTDANILAQTEETISTYGGTLDHWEQCTDEIWAVICKCVKTLTKQYPKGEIKGIGFITTDSVVVVRKNGDPLTVSNSGESNRNVFSWEDKRSSVEIKHIETIFTKYFRYRFGQTNITLKNVLPKILWLKKNLRETWRQVRDMRVFYLYNYLTWRASGVGHYIEGYLWLMGIDDNFYDLLEEIGLYDFKETVREMADEVTQSQYGMTLTKSAAEDLGLNHGIAVGEGRSIGYPVKPDDDCPYIADVEISELSRDVTEVLPEWVAHARPPRDTFQIVLTPDYSVHKDPMLISPDIFIEELVLKKFKEEPSAVESYIELHPVFKRLQGDPKVADIRSYLNNYLRETYLDWERLTEITRGVNIVPDFRDETAIGATRAIINGFTVKDDVDNLALLYLSILQSLAYTLLLKMKKTNYHLFPDGLRSIYIADSVYKNPVYFQCLADVFGKPVLVSKSADSFLYSAAVIGIKAFHIPDPDKNPIEPYLRTSHTRYLPHLKLANYHKERFYKFDHFAKICIAVTMDIRNQTKHGI